MAVPMCYGLGIVIRPHEVGLTCPVVLPIRQSTFSYGHHNRFYSCGAHYPLIKRNVRSGQDSNLYPPAYLTDAIVAETLSLCGIYSHLRHLTIYNKP